MCVNTLKVYAGCPAGFDLNSFAKAPPSKDSNKTDEEILKETIRTIIPLTDVDSDNKTSLEELTNWTQKSLRTAHQADAKARLKHLDTNKDNKVTWEEFLKSKEDIGATTEEQKKRRFNHADEDKNGWLTQDEITSMFHPEEKPHMFDIVVDEYLEMADNNKDGFLSYDEYKIKMAKKGKANQKVAKKFFTQQDKDQDGKLSRDEIKQWLASINTASHAKKQAEMLMNTADDNKDGLLEEKEILNHLDLFMGDKKKQKPKKKVKKDEL